MTTDSRSGEHLTRLELIRVRNGTIEDDSTVLRVVSHLSKGCPVCWERVQNLRVLTTRARKRNLHPVSAALRRLTMSPGLSVDLTARHRLSFVKARSMPYGFLLLAIEEVTCDTDDHAEQQRRLDQIYPVILTLVDKDDQHAYDARCRYFCCRTWVAWKTERVMTDDIDVDLQAAINAYYAGTRAQWVWAIYLETQAEIAEGSKLDRCAAAVYQKAAALLRRPEEQELRAWLLWRQAGVLAMRQPAAVSKIIRVLREALSLLEGLEPTIAPRLRLEVVHLLATTVTDQYYCQRLRKNPMAATDLSLAAELLEGYQDLYQQYGSKRVHLVDRAELGALIALVNDANQARTWLLEAISIYQEIGEEQSATAVIELILQAARVLTGWNCGEYWRLPAQFALDKDSLARFVSKLEQATAVTATPREFCLWLLQQEAIFNITNPSYW